MRLPSAVALSAVTACPPVAWSGRAPAKSACAPAPMTMCCEAHLDLRSKLLTGAGLAPTGTTFGWVWVRVGASREGKMDLGESRS